MQRSLAQHNLVLPIIKRVMRRGNLYLCSLCRTEHHTAVEANHCLNTCWYDIKNFYPVVLRKLDKRRWVFRCHFCCRDYQVESEAYDCALRCLDGRNEVHLKEQILNDLPLAPPSKKPSRIRLITMQKRVSSASKHKSSKPQQLAKPIADKALEIVATELELPNSSAPSRPKGKHLREFKQKWMRKNEKYQCKYCHKQHYTRLEAESCFADHFDAEGYEKETKT